MAHSLRFSRLHDYGRAGSGITVPAVLTWLETSVRLLAKVDTGADLCIFQRAHGEALGLDIETGTRLRVGTVTGSFIAYGHRLFLSVLEYRFDSVVYFAAEESFTRNVLGRKGWLQNLRLGLVDHDGRLYVSSYDDSRYDG